MMDDPNLDLLARVADALGDLRDRNAKSSGFCAQIRSASLKASLTVWIAWLASRGSPIE